MFILFVIFILVPLGIAYIPTYLIFKALDKKYGRAGSVTGAVLTFLLVSIGIFLLIAYNFRIER